MKQHKTAQLTLAQRSLIQELCSSGKASKSELARRFNVNRKTINRWVNRDSPFDKPSGPKEPRRVITPAYRKAVIAYRKSHPDRGPKTIAYHLKAEFSFANRGTIHRILQQEGMNNRSQKEKKSGVH